MFIWDIKYIHNQFKILICFLLGKTPKALSRITMCGIETEFFEHAINIMYYIFNIFSKTESSIYILSWTKNWSLIQRIYIILSKMMISNKFKEIQDTNHLTIIAFLLWCAYSYLICFDVFYLWRQLRFYRSFSLNLRLKSSHCHNVFTFFFKSVPNKVLKPIINLTSHFEYFKDIFNTVLERLQESEYILFAGNRETFWKLKRGGG